jgi:hypothetical protein
MIYRIFEPILSSPCFAYVDLPILLILAAFTDGPGDDPNPAAANVSDTPAQPSGDESRDGRENRA